MARARPGHPNPFRYGEVATGPYFAGRAAELRELIADLQGGQNKERLADHLATAIYAGLVAPVERAWHRALDLFQALPLRPKLSVGQDGSPSSEFAPGVPERDVDADGPRAERGPADLLVLEETRWLAAGYSGRQPLL